MKHAREREREKCRSAVPDALEARGSGEPTCVCELSKTQRKHKVSTLRLQVSEQRR